MTDVCRCRDHAPCSPCLSEKLARVALLTGAADGAGTSGGAVCDPDANMGAQPFPSPGSVSDGFSLRVPEDALPDPVGSLSGMFLDERVEVSESSLYDRRNEFGATGARSVDSEILP